MSVCSLLGPRELHKRSPDPFPSKFKRELAHIGRRLLPDLQHDWYFRLSLTTNSIYGLESDIPHDNNPARQPRVAAMLPISSMEGACPAARLIQ